MAADPALSRTQGHVQNLYPKWTFPLLPVTFTGITAPHPFFLKNGSTGFSSQRFHLEATISEISALVCTLPWRSTTLPASLYVPLSCTSPPGSEYSSCGNVSWP